MPNGSKCVSCGAANPEGARFCMSCGKPLAHACPSCGTAVPDGARFCMGCGSALDADVQAPPAARVHTPPEHEPEERRLASVLFADLSGFTAASEVLDPEAARTLSDRCLRRLTEEVVRFGGTVDKYIGDNVMAVFGVPATHEDDAERAVRAGLAMQEAMLELAAGGVELSLRVGVNTGEVIAGKVADSYTVMGDTVNVAARLQTAAQPGAVVVGERTARATAAAVEYRELVPLELKGKAERVRAWEAVQTLGAEPSGRINVGLSTPLVGRADELELMESVATRMAREGSRQLVTVVGQAGVGKSRLLVELTQRLVERGTVGTVRQGRCLPYGSGIAYWALAEVMRADCGIDESDDAGTAWAKLLARAEDLIGTDAGAREAAIIGRSLGLEVPDDLVPPDEDDPQRFRERFFSAVRNAVQAMVEREPMLVAFEDIHWADHGMLDLIEYLADWVRGPLMRGGLTRDARRERRPGWGGGRRD
jgi:class 3 adenylate cyclase